MATQYDVVTPVKRDDYVSPYVPGDGNAYPTPESVSSGSRVQDQQYVYDGRGNITHSSDDANVFFDRSLGTVVQGTGDRLTSASFDPSVLTDTGALATAYDGAGNLTSVDIHNGSSYAYAWDELGRLASATRTDIDGTQVEQDYTYDATGQRVDTAKSEASAPAVHTIQVFDSLVLKNAAFPDAGGKDYQHDDTTESVYLAAAGQALGRAFYAETPLPSASSGQVHVFMPIADPLGSTAFVIDHDTGEIVEAMGYLPYGGVDSDYRPTRWNYAREDVRYTGHWDNAEVGLVYMNARYYSPQLNRFISPDPQTIHAAKGDLNPYAYASGSLMRYTDPTGLYDQYSPCAFGAAECSDSYQPINLPGDPPSNKGTSAQGNVAAPDDDTWTLAAEDEAFAQQRSDLADLQGPAQQYESIKDQAVVQLTEQAVLGPAGEVLSIE